MVNEIFKNNYDVIIVGAGPGGCCAAFHCAKNGMKVLILDKAIFPRDKICGDGISHTSMECLQTMGMLDILEKNNGYKIREIKVTSSDNNFVKGEPTKKVGMREYAMVMPRQDLDNLLVEKIKTIHNITFMEEINVIDLIDDGHITQITAKKSNQQILKFKTSYVIGADGAMSVIARKIGINMRKYTHGNFAMRAYFNHVSDMSDCIELFCYKDQLPGYAWIFPTGMSTANIGVIIPRKKYNSDKLLLKSLFNNIITNSPIAKKRLGNAVQIPGTLKGWPLPVYPYTIKRSKNNTVLIGDAAGFTDPLTGEGIYYAMKSGEFAAEAITKVQTSSKAKTVSSFYEKIWKKAFLWNEFIPSKLLRISFNYESLVNWKVKSVKHSVKKSGIYLGAIGHTLPKSKLFLP